MKNKIKEVVKGVLRLDVITLAVAVLGVGFTYFSLEQNQAQFEQGFEQRVKEHSDKNQNELASIRLEYLKLLNKQ